MISNEMKQTLIVEEPCEVFVMQLKCPKCKANMIFNGEVHDGKGNIDSTYGHICSGCKHTDFVQGEKFPYQGLRPIK